MESATLQRQLNGPDGHWPHRKWALLDIREAGEAYSGHIPTATALPRRLLDYRIRSMIPDLGTKIVVYDAGTLVDGISDQRAARAARTLEDIGYTDIKILAGGFSAWKDSGGEIATGANVPSKRFGERVLEEDQVPAITADDLADAISNQENIAIRDVRTVEEFAHHHLPGAVSTPGFDLAASIGKLADDHDLIVINCAGRTRSIIATATARRLGIENVRALENGTMGWRLAGKEVQSGANDPSQLRAVQNQNSSVLQKANALAKSVDVEMIGSEQLVSILDTPALRPVIVDLRSLSEFSDEHLPHAIALPGGQAIQRTDEFLATPGRPIVLYDSDELRALLGGYWLKRMGFAKVMILAGGFNHWRTNGNPTASGRHERPVIPNEEMLRKKVTLVAPADAASVLGKGDGDHLPAFLDVRTSRDYRAGHATGSSWAPRGWLEVAVRHFPLSRTIVLVGQNDAQALLAASQLIGEGYRQVMVIKGGFGGWSKAGLSVETGLSADSERYLPDLVEPPYGGDLSRMRAYLDWEVALHSHGSAST